ncbi:hypothetical protein QA860_08285 [Streptomyces stelliscabiei]|uniref:hypothetical protein n=1 Tax=Streptomyces stelliscabiei TaxID=146820 RepID=UPI002FF16E3E
MANPNQDARNGKGRYERTVETAERDALAAKMRARGHTYHEIGLELGVTRTNAQLACQRALADVVREPAEDLLKLELQRLDLQLVRLHQLETAARKVLEARHITVNNGKVIYNPGTEEPMEDDGPVLQAIDRLVKIEAARNQNSERRAKLTGIEAALKVEATVHEVTQQDIELQAMLREAKAHVAAQEEALRDRPGGEA